MTFPLRHEIGAFRDPARVEIVVNDRRADELVLDTGEWYVARVTMPPLNRSWTRRMHRVHVSIPRI